jgi:hypothetical protein
MILPIMYESCFLSKITILFNTNQLCHASRLVVQKVGASDAMRLHSEI